LTGKKVPYTFADWRPGDQKVFVADTRKAEKALSWKAHVDPAEGVRRLSSWVQENKALFTV
jgi:CDP-paratose 2-epimerase